MVFQGRGPGLPSVPPGGFLPLLADLGPVGELLHDLGQFLQRRGNVDALGTGAGAFAAGDAGGGTFIDRKSVV